MSDGECRFTSDRRGREEASWVGQADWEAGTVENVDVTTDGLVGRRPDQTGDVPASGTIADFESGNLDSWPIGELSEISLTTDSFAGTYAAEGIAGGSSYIVSDVGDGLDHYPQRGQVFRGRVNTSYDNRARFNWCMSDVADHGSGFSIQADTRSDVYRLTGYGDEHEVSGNAPAGEWLEFEIVWNYDDTVVGTWYGESGSELISLSIDPTESVPQTGAVCLYSSDSSTPGIPTRWDEIRITDTV
jgi:hypothetical protein